MKKENNKLNQHSGKFTSLMFRNGGKVSAYCAKIIKITDQTVTFKCQNSGEVIMKKLASLV